MKHRSTLVYFLLVILLAGFYLYDTWKKDKKKETEVQAARVFDIQPGQLQSITLTKGAEVIRLEKSGVSGTFETWEIARPVRVPTDPDAINRIKTRMAELKSRREIAQNDGDPAAFGLDRPVFSITLEAVNKSTMLRFGAQNPQGDAYYAGKNNDSAILLIDRYEKDDLDQSLFDLRDKRVFTIPAEKVGRLVITRGSTVFDMVKKDGQWLLEGNQTFKLDQAKTEAFIRHIAQQEALTFENENASDLKPYGLNSPQDSIILTGDNCSEQLLIGNPFSGKDRGRIYAKIKGKPQVVTVSTGFVSSLLSLEKELQEKPQTGPIQK